MEVFMDRNQEIMDHSKEEMIKHLESAVVAQ
jgi:hypothetical protein